MCTEGPSCGVLLTTWNSWDYYKVAVNGTMNDTNVRNACVACGLDVPCQATGNCQYNDNLCVQTSNEVSCGNPMLGLSNFLCNNVSPSQCAQLYNTYQYMGQSWSGACGAKAGQWCVSGNGQSNQDALCVLPK